METGNLSEDYRPLILVAEDDDSNFKLIKAIIGKKCEILWAKNGEEMVNLFKENRGKTAAILMLVMVSVMFTACGSNSSDKSDNATQESTSEYVSEDIKVAALKGPTAIGMVKLMSDNEDNKTANNYTFQIEAAADAFTADLIKGDVQIAAMPCNAAATLYNKSNGKVSVVGINTLGVLYILDNKGEVTNVSDLKGRTIYTTGKGTTPEYTLRYLLNTNGIDPDKDVHIEFKSEASEVAAIMASAKEETVAMLPQPFATTVLMNNKEARIALDVTKEWENVSKDGSTVVTGVIVVNTEYYNNHKAAVDKFLEEYKLSADYVNANVDEVSTLVEKYGITKAAVAKQAIPKCNITIITGSDAKDKISKYLNVLYEANPASVGGKLPEDNFYK